MAESENERGKKGTRGREAGKDEHAGGREQKRRDKRMKMRVWER